MNRALWKNSVDSKTEPQSDRGSDVIALEEAEGQSAADSDDSAPEERRNRSSKGVPKRYIPVVFPRG